MALWKATYRKSGTGSSNPFSQTFFTRLPFESSAIPEIPEGISVEQIKEWAKDATPDGYDFVDVKLFTY